MVDQSDIALVTPLECNKRSVDSFGVEHLRFFEEEAIRCMKSWRKNGGWLKDIKIYALNATRAKVQKKTIGALEDLGVVCIDDYCPETDTFSSPFLNEPFCGMYFEATKPCKEKILVKTDLDMQLLKPIPEELFETAKSKVVIGQYDEESSKDQRGVLFKKSKFKLPFDTNFIISSRDSGFYQRYFDACQSKELLASEEWSRLKAESGSSYYIEEFAIDWLASQRDFEDKLYPIVSYQYGEGYPPLRRYSDDEVQRIMFLHEHIYKDNKFPNGYDAVKEHMEYLKRMMRKGR